MVKRCGYTKQASSSVRLCWLRELQEPHQFITKLFTKCNWHSTVLLPLVFSCSMQFLEIGNAHITKSRGIDPKSVQGYERLLSSRLRVCQLPIELAVWHLTATAITVTRAVCTVSHPCFREASMMAPGGQGFKIVAQRKPNSPPRRQYGTTPIFSSSPGLSLSWRIIKRFDLSLLLFWPWALSSQSDQFSSAPSFQI
jgi:hypothetical protein